MRVPSEPPLDVSLVCGLPNFGNTCYINSVVQALLHLPPFIRLFLTEDKRPKRHNGSCNLTNKLGGLLSDMLTAQVAAPYAPQSTEESNIRFRMHAIKMALAEIRPDLFSGDSQRDAFNVFREILQAMHVRSSVFV